MLSQVWLQHRWLEFGGYISARDTVRTLMPQGDGLSPLVILIIMSARCMDIAQQMGASYVYSTFLDDRA